jgi:hypothetical protein
MRMFFQRHVFSRVWSTFVVLGMSLAIFGACTANLGLLLMANFHLLQVYGWRAAMDGAVAQFFELVATGYGGLVFYVIFKSCEHRLTDWLSHAH